MSTVIAAPVYVVLDEHTLGYLISSTSMGVLRGSVLRGSPFDPRSGPIAVGLPSEHLRPATAVDFAAFGVRVPPDFAAGEPEDRG